MNKITKNQFASLLLITDAFVLFCLKGSISVFTSAGFVTGTVLQLILTLSLVPFFRKGGNIEQCGKTTELIYFIYILLWGGMLFAMLWDTADVIYIPYEKSGIWGELLVSTVIAVVCIYISSIGVKSLSRSAVIAVSIGVLCLLIVTVSALFKSDWNNLTMLNDSDGFLQEVIKGFAVSGSLGSLVIFAEFTEGDILDNIFFYFTGKVILFTVILLVSVLVSGGIMLITDFPVVTSAQISQPFSVQRIDSLFLIIFSVFGVFSIAVQAGAGVYLLKNMFPNFAKFSSISVLLLMILSGLLFSNIQINSIIMLISVVFIVVTAPTVYYTKNPLKNRGQ